MSKSIRLAIEMTREEDGTYSIAAENPDAVGEAQYIDGLSEGFVTDHFEAANAASEIVKTFLIDNGWRLDPEKQDLAATTPWGEIEPVEFKRHES